MATRRRKREAASIPAFAADSSPDSPKKKQNKGAERKVPNVRTLIRRLWQVAAPYWFSEDKVQARLRLAGVFFLTVATTGISVCFNFIGRDFHNALANKDQEKFTKQLLYYLAAFACGIPVFVFRDYSKDTLSLRWRSWMTSYYMDRYMKNRTFYKIQSQSIIDNPDQRIVDDLSSFTGTALHFSLTVLNATVDLISFSNILYRIHPPLFAALICYSLGGTALSVFLGKGLVNLNFLQEKKEADFRYGLVRIRENAESIAFYGGEENERQLLLQRFRKAFENLSELLISSRNLDFFTRGYKYLIKVLPVAVIAPMYFSGKIEFGVINQSVSAFNHILGDFSLIVYEFQAITVFSAVIDRLGEFDDLLTSSVTRSDAKPMEEISHAFSDICSSRTLNGSLHQGESKKLLSIKNLTVITPSEATLIRDLSFEVYEKGHLLVTGASGSGKTSFLRSVAGLWSFGKGTVTFYERNETNLHSNKHKNNHSKGVFFLPQKPYMVLGTLRQQLLYPTWSEDHSSMIYNDKPTDSLPVLKSAQETNEMLVKPRTDHLIQALEDVRLSYILSRFDLDSTHEWSSVLSVGEQQRIAFARLLLSKPDLVLLDESTSALDETNEAHLYGLIAAAGVTYISIGHRRSLYRYHKNVLHISPVEPTNSSRNWQFEPINKD